MHPSEKTIIAGRALERALEDDRLIKLDLCFGTVDILEAPPRVEGRYLYPRGRTIERDRHGNVIRDETYDVGSCLVDWEPVAHLFGVAAPAQPKTWWQRMANFLK